MKKYRIAFLILLLSPLILVACGGTVNAEPKPPTIHYGEDICEACGMIISDARFAAAYVTEDGVGYTFDEIVGMLNTHLAKQDAIAAFFVHDYLDQNWIRAETATFVLSDDLITPMAFGLVAFASPEEAQALATETEGELFSFEEVMHHYQQQAPGSTGDMPAVMMEDHTGHGHDP